MKSSRRLEENASRIVEVEKELARLERVLGTARLAQYEKVPHIEEEASIVRTSLELFIDERLRLRHRAAERSLASKAQLSVARERLTELIKDARLYAAYDDLSQRFRKEIDRTRRERTRREAVIKRADMAKELALTRERKVIDAEFHQLVDDMLEARTLDANRYDPKVLARAITDILGEVSMLRRDVDRGKVREILWEIIKAIVAAATGSSALALYHMLSRMDPAAQARAGAEVREESWCAARDSVTDVTLLFAEPLAPRNLFSLLFHLAGPILRMSSIISAEGTVWDGTPRLACPALTSPRLVNNRS